MFFLPLQGVYIKFWVGDTCPNSCVPLDGSCFSNNIFFVFFLSNKSVEGLGLGVSLGEW